jgi:hypothetical protein
MVLLGIRTEFKKDVQASVSELVYGEPLSISGELLSPTAEPVDPLHLITELRQYTARLRPVPVERHGSPSTFLNSDLESCTQGFLRQDTTHLALENPTAAPTKSCNGERRLCNFSCAGGLSLCQPTGSSRPTSSTGQNAGETSSRQQQQPRPQHHQQRRQGPPQEQDAPLVISISLLA